MHGRVITKSNCSAISGFPVKIDSTEILQNMITEIHVLNICLGATQMTCFYPYWIGEREKS